MVILALVMFLLGLIIGYALGNSKYLKKDRSANSTDNESQTIQESTIPSITPTASVESDNPVGHDERIYTSQTLGVKFTYSTTTDTHYRWPVSVTESGNKIQFLYQHPDQQKKSPSQHFEVFNKNRSQDLKTTIQEKILDGYDLEDCLVKTTDQPPITNRLVPGIIYAEILTPNFENQEVGMDVIFDEALKCPKDYTRTNSIGYFYYDPGHSDKFLYISLGQESGMLLQKWQGMVPDHKIC